MLKQKKSDIKVDLNDQIRYLIALESNASRLLELYGARECSCCKQVKIDCAPFFIDDSICSDCEDALLDLKPIGLVC